MSGVYEHFHDNQNSAGWLAEQLTKGPWAECHTFDADFFRAIEDLARMTSLDAIGHPCLASDSFPINMIMSTFISQKGPGTDLTEEDLVRTGLISLWLRRAPNASHLMSSVGSATV